MSGLLTMHANWIGLANRLKTWHYLYELSKFYDMKIVLSWKEVEDRALILPNTSYMGSNHFNTFIPFDGKIENLEAAEFDRSKNYILTACWDFNHKLSDWQKAADFLSFSKEYEQVVANNFNQFKGQRIIGLHVRRGDFTVTNCFRTDGHFQIPASWYIDVCCKVLKKFPDALFFLASDGTPKEKDVFLRSLPSFCMKKVQGFRFLHILDFIGLSRNELNIESISTFSLLTRLHKCQSIGISPKCENQNIDVELERYLQLTK